MAPGAKPAHAEARDVDSILIDTIFGDEAVEERVEGLRIPTTPFGLRSSVFGPLICRIGATSPWAVALNTLIESPAAL